MMPKPNTDGGFILPGVINPPRRCVQLQIPDDRAHIAAFWGALESLQMWFSWQRDSGHTGVEVAHVWREVLDDARALFWSDEPCPCEDSMADCCEPILEKLETIIGLLSAGTRPDPIAQIAFRNDITTIINVPGWVPSDLHPAAPDDSFTFDESDEPSDLEFRQTALCHLLYLSCMTLARETRQTVFHAGLAISLDAFLSGWWLPATVIGLGSLIAAGLTWEALSDEVAIGNVVCCMAEALEGMDVTASNLRDAAAGCAVGGNETLIAGGLESMFADDETFGAFVHDLGQAFDKLSKGAELYCPCAEPAGVECSEEGIAVGIDLPAGGGSGWTPESTGGACANFGTILNGGGEFIGSSSFCLETVSLRRMYGGTATNEALFARVTVNNVAFYQAIEPSEHCTVTITPNQLIDSEHGFRIELLGGGERMCYTGVRFTGKAVS